MLGGQEDGGGTGSKSIEYIRDNFSEKQFFAGKWEMM